MDASPSPARTAFRELRYASSDGLPLYARDYGDVTSPWLPIVCLPGLTRTHRDFHALAEYFAAHRDRPRRVLAFDYRGRGGSAWDPNPANYNIAMEMGDVLDGMVAAGVSRAVIVGTSRGGIIGMLMALARPQTVAALVLNDIGPLIEPAGLVRLRAYVGRTPPPQDWADAVQIQRRLHAAYFVGFDHADWERFARLTYRDDAGLPARDYDPQLAVSLAAIELEEPSPGIWKEFAALGRLPILVIRGGNSDILSAATLERMAAEHRDLETVVIEDEGHAPLLRSPALLARLAAFISLAEDANPV